MARDLNKLDRSESLADAIRHVLGPHNDDAQPVVELVRQLAERTPPAGLVDWRSVRRAALTFAQDGDCTALDRALARAGAPCPRFKPTAFGGDTCYFCARDVRGHTPVACRAYRLQEVEG